MQMGLEHPSPRMTDYRFLLQFKTGHVTQHAHFFAELVEIMGVADHQGIRSVVEIWYWLR
jgi:hypothetical protein